MKTIEKAREIVRNFAFDKTQLANFTKNGDFNYYDNDSKTSKSFTEITSDVIAGSLSYIINIEECEYSHNELGLSKQNGHPHLPSDWKQPSAWGKKYLFLMQLNFQEIKPYDIDGI